MQRVPVSEQRHAMRPIQHTALKLDSTEMQQLSRLTLVVGDCHGTKTYKTLWISGGRGDAGEYSTEGSRSYIDRRETPPALLVELKGVENPAYYQ